MLAVCMIKCYQSMKETYVDCRVIPNTAAEVEKYEELMGTLYPQFGCFLSYYNDEQGPFNGTPMRKVRDAKESDVIDWVKANQHLEMTDEAENW